MARDDDYVPISCGDYEVFEIACMDRYDVELTMRDGRRVVGKAVDLAVSPPKSSWSSVTKTARARIFAWITSGTWPCCRARADSTTTPFQARAWSSPRT
jgi:transcriptional antiterminator Rof (Rho-off)